MQQKICTSFPSLPFILSLIWESLRLLKVAAIRVLAPLRRVVTREAKVFNHDRVKGTPSAFAVIATLDCGHSFKEFSWYFIDLVYAYTANPEVLARRHRCHDCRDIALAKKPVKSVSVEAMAVAS
jgi:hypothetical protein